MTTSLVGLPAARAEVEHPRQLWMRESTAGLFLHWGMFTAPRHLDCADWERDVTAGGWNPDYWVDEARKLGASYIVLATFHSRLGYARPWPSTIPGSCATRRDFLGELVQAGKAKGVRVLLYMSDDPQWHNEQGVETLESGAYSAYKGQDVDLTTRHGFGMYSYDLFFEVMEDYPDLAGFWIDNDNAYWEEHGLYEQVRERRPDWLLSNNNEDTPIMDTVSNEQKTGMTPAYDYPAAAWTPMPRLTEADYKLPTTGAWWYDGTDHPVDFGLATGRYITNAGSSMKSLMAETPMVNGRFPPNQERFNDFMASWLPPIRSSLAGTEGGGYMYGGMQPGYWNAGAHGVVTVEPETGVQYVHVVTRPRTDLVRLRDNGYRVTRVTNLRTGDRMRFAQSGGHLTILDVRDWDPYDTVFRVETDGRHFFYDDVAASDPRLVDGDFRTYSDNAGVLPVEVVLDLGSRRRARYLAVHQREWSPTYARETFGRPEDSARIKDYRVSVSDDGVRWERPVRTGVLPSARGVRFIDIGEQRSRYIRLEVLDTWAGPQAPAFHRQLKVDEIEVAYAYPGTRGPAVPRVSDAATVDWSVEMVESTMKRYSPEELGSWSYTCGLYLYGQYLVYRRTGDERYLAYIKAWVDRFVDENGDIDNGFDNLDAMLSGRLLTILHREYDEDRYRIAARKIRDRLDDYPRTSDGGFWHADSDSRRSQLWADGVFMVNPFLVEYGREFDDAAYADDEATRQLVVYADHLRQANGLLRHAYDESRDAGWADPDTGVSPEHWCRAIGWYAMASIDVLEVIPGDHPRRPELVRILRDLVAGFAEFQDPETGRWFQVVDKGSEPDNWTETSCSSMYAFTISRAVERGYVDASYQDVADRGYQGVLEKISLGDDGLTDLADISIGTNVGDYDYYVDRDRETNDFHGLGAFLIMNEQFIRSRS